MKPILLIGHERPLTYIKYNHDGDLLFTASKDKKVCCWYSDNGERVGTYNGHIGAVWSVDVNRDSSRVLTGGADDTCKLWECMTGKELYSWEVDTAVRTCGFSMGGNRIFFSTDKRMRKPCQIFFHTLAEDPANQSTEPDLVITIPDEFAKVTAALWGPLDEYIVTGHEDGVLRTYCAKTGECLATNTFHSGPIMSLRCSKDKEFVITGSKDHNAALFTSGDLQHLKTYPTDKNVNAAAISPTRDHVVIGGGQEAMEAALTHAKSGKFDARFFHMIFEEEIGRIKGHFGPINTIDFHPSGRSYASGAEDGFIRIHHFDEDYHLFRFQV